MVSAKDIDYVVCMPRDSTQYFDDDVFSKCSECGCEVRLRPHSYSIFSGSPKAQIICIKCMVEKTENKE